MIIAGIDEAGLGPVLGPLVVTATAISVPDDSAETCLWDVLSPAVSRKPSRRRTSVAIGDSKKLYTRRSKAGLEHLERAVLGMLGASGRTPATFRELLGIIAPGAPAAMRRYPWYAGCDLTLPRRITSMDAAFAANGISEAMRRGGAVLETICCETVLVDEFNKIVRATRNKSVAMLDVACRLLTHIWNRSEGPMRIYVDRLGGRKHYLPALQRVFGGCNFKVIEETDTSSGYLLVAADKQAEIWFSTGAEERQLPVALASMTSKYVRELFMAMFNAFWQTHVPDLASTAGYYTDGRRFFGEILPAMQELSVDRDILYRYR